MSKNYKLSQIIVYLIILAFFVPTLILPLSNLFIQAFSNGDGDFVGLLNFYEYLKTPGLLEAFYHTITVGFIVTFIVLILGFTIAYSLTHVRIFGKKFLSMMYMLPIFVPSLLPAIGLIYLFGNQGIFKFLLGDNEIYGPLGIIIGSTVFALPHVVVLLITSLRHIDEKLYFAAATLGASDFRKFLTITLPNCKYGLVSAAIVAFTLTITDFGVPKVLGGNFSMLATEIYSQVIGQQNFNMGAIISIVLLMPSVLTLSLDSWARRSQRRLVAPSTRLTIRPSLKKDLVFTTLCWMILLLITSSIIIVVWASFISFWPYDFSFSLNNYNFEEFGYSYTPIITSILMALGSATLGSIILFLGAYLVERGLIPSWLKAIYRTLLILPLSIPGLVLGLAYIMTFNQGPLSFLYGTLAIIIINTVIHFSTVSHLTFTSALSKINKSYENVGRSMGISPWITTLKVVFPESKKVFLDVFFYIFVNAMTTVSAVVFLCSSDVTLASISIVNMYDSGDLGPAAAMGTMILIITLAAECLTLIKMFVKK